MQRFRVGISSNFIDAKGNPAFASVDFSPLADDGATDIVQMHNGRHVQPEEIAGIDAVILGGELFDAHTLSGDGRLGLVARFGVGYDQVNLDDCTRHGVAVSITPNGVRRPLGVATLTLLLALFGKLRAKDKFVRTGASGMAGASPDLGIGLIDKTIGLLGIGNIGSEFVRISQPLGIRFIAHDPYADKKTVAELGVTLVGLEELFRESDAVSVHCPLSRETRKLVGARLIGLMKPTAFLINTARGGIVDQAALVAALKECRIAGAGLDVLDPEPPHDDDPILALDNVILAPHTLGCTDQGFHNMGAEAVTAVKALRRGEAPAHVVNKAVLESPAWKRRLDAYRSRRPA